MKFITESERLLLRELNPSDAEEFYALNANPKVLQYVIDEPFESVDAARERLENYDEYEKHGYGRWAVIRKSDEKFLGWCGLKFHDEYIDLGYRFFEEEWGKGYATESAKACIEYAFNELGVKQLVARAAKGNDASVRVMEKLGMEFWKRDICDGMEDAKYYVLKA